MNRFRDPPSPSQVERLEIYLETRPNANRNKLSDPRRSPISYTHKMLARATRHIPDAVILLSNQFVLSFFYRTRFLRWRKPGSIVQVLRSTLYKNTQHDPSLRPLVFRQYSPQSEIRLQIQHHLRCSASQIIRNVVSRILGMEVVLAPEYPQSGSMFERP